MAMNRSNVKVQLPIGKHDIAAVDIECTLIDAIHGAMLLALAVARHNDLDSQRLWSRRQSAQPDTIDRRSFGCGALLRRRGHQIGADYRDRHKHGDAHIP